MHVVESDPRPDNLIFEVKRLEVDLDDKLFE